MKNTKIIAFLGGDLRQYTAAEALAVDGAELRLWGMDHADRGGDVGLRVQHPVEAVSGASAVVLPLPASTDGVTLNCPFDSSQRHLRLEELLSYLSPATLLIGGRIPKDFAAQAESQGLRVRDYFEWEAFQIENAYTTAEAALSIAMNSLNRNISGARVAVTGFGRIAKHLVRLLLALNARVTVAARRREDLSWAESLGCDTLRIREGLLLSPLAHGYDVIYNTVPHWLFTREFLEGMDSATFLIDLASVPGGVDIRAAKELGSNVLWATSLPGKYAPVSAGRLIASCVDRILREEVAAE